MQDLFTERDLVDAVDELAMLPFFPTESRGAVMALLGKMCPYRTALRWLVAEATNHLDRWPGPAELRGLLCTRYDAADGVDQWCSLPGYRAEDAEEKHYEQHKQLLAGGYAEESLALVRQLDQGMHRRTRERIDA
jgi:hypothetical protein